MRSNTEAASGVDVAPASGPYLDAFIVCYRSLKMRLGCRPHWQDPSISPRITISELDVDGCLGSQRSADSPNVLELFGMLLRDLGT